MERVHEIRQLEHPEPDVVAVFEPRLCLERKRMDRRAILRHRVRHEQRVVVLLVGEPNEVAHIRHVRARVIGELFILGKIAARKVEAIEPRERPAIGAEARLWPELELEQRDLDEAYLDHLAWPRMRARPHEDLADVDESRERRKDALKQPVVADQRVLEVEQSHVL